MLPGQFEFSIPASWIVACLHYDFNSDRFQTSSAQAADYFYDRIRHDLRPSRAMEAGKLRSHVKQRAHVI